MQQVVAMPMARAAAGPVLAVVPAASAPASPEVALLTAGLLEEVCGELARFATLRVISWASSQALAERCDAEIAARLRATHVLRGGLRRLVAAAVLGRSIDCRCGAGQRQRNRQAIAQRAIGTAARKVGHAKHRSKLS